MNTRFRLGTRKSELAKIQSEQVRRALSGYGVQCELVEIQSRGDIDKTTPLYEIENAGPGLFTKQLEDALLRGQIDLAVHSLKDLPTTQPQGLVVAAIPQREASGDTLLVHASRYDERLPLGLPRGATVGTSSLRREAELLAIRSDVRVVPLRGSVPTRVHKVGKDGLDAAILAQAGLRRLALAPHELVSVALASDQFVPAPGQGALAVETRADASPLLRHALASLHHEPSFRETHVERQILRELEGGCTLPLGVRCELQGGVLKVRAFLGRKREGRWVGFEYCDAQGTEEKAVVQSIVSHLKHWQDEVGHG